ncbi:MAG: carboxypeptidase-like regulatory domain-containing protein [Flavobacteriales bacterium]|nr:carboxypeptidase-like regulatory domain-containing protein [Flavobacteriales bacterium]
MIKRYLFLIILLFSFVLIEAQEKITVVGKIIDLETGKTIENVHVKVSQRNIVTKSDAKGNYHISISKRKRMTLVFSHISYETNYEPINTKKDTIFLTIKLIKKIEDLPIFIMDGKPKIVFKSAKINIADYEFHEDKFLFLVYGKRLNKHSEIYLVDENENIISKHFVPGEPVELYTDYLGNVNLICKRAIYRVSVENDRVVIYELPMDDFNLLIKPIVDTLESTLLFSDFLRQFPRFKYYAFNPEDTTISIIKEVVHKDMDWKYAFEYEFLNNADKQFAKRMAKRLKGYDKFDVAASMTGFSNGFLYETVYAPLYVINDTINIFDHSESRTWKFVDDTVEVGDVPFLYHKPKKKNSWKRQLIMDEVNGNIYGVF